MTAFRMLIAIPALAVVAFLWSWVCCKVLFAFFDWLDDKRGRL